MTYWRTQAFARIATQTDPASHSREAGVFFAWAAVCMRSVASLFI